MAITQRYLDIDNGHMILTGNTLLIYQENTVNGGPFTTVDTALQVPGYPAGTTTDWQLNSSMAVLTLPPGTTVHHAELTWTSLLISGSFNYTAFAADPVTFLTPAGPTTVAPQFTDVTNDIYTRSADVTALVQAGGSGQYTLGRVAGVNGLESTGLSGNGAGWYLSVVVKNPAEPSRLFQINVGNAFVPALSTIDFSIGGFSTPTSGPVTGRLFAGVQRGDPQVDLISIFVGPDTGNLNYQLTRPPMPDNNMMIGIISNTETGALIDTSGTFGTSNNIPNPPTAVPFARWHIDIASFDISPSLSNNQTTLVTRSVSEGPISVFDYNVYNVQIDARTANVLATKTVDKPFAKVGDTLTYTITATNSGTIAADNVVITDPIPTGTTYVPGSVTGATGVPPTLTIPGSIAPGDTVTVTFQVTVDEIPTENPLVNTATVDYTFIPLPGEPPISSSSTTGGASTQVNSANVVSGKTVTPSYAEPGAVLNYTITLQNTGNVVADNVVITDALPAGATYVAGSLTGATGTFPTLTLLGPIAAGGTATVTYQLKLGASIPNPNPMINTAGVAYTYTVDPANPNGASGTDNAGTASVQVNTAKLTIVKQSDKGIAYIGDTITYQLAVSNSGNVSANNVVLTDPIPNGTTLVPGSLVVSQPYSGSLPNLTLTNPIAAGQTVTILYKVTVTAKPNPNPIVNTAAATYAYTVDPENPNGVTATAQSNSVSTRVFGYNYSQQITDLIESVALEQAALAAIANAEGAKIQAAVAMGEISQQELLCINRSVTEMMDSITLLENVLRQKLNIVSCQIDGGCTA